MSPPNSAYSILNYKCICNIPVAIQACHTPIGVSFASHSYTGTKTGDTVTYTCDSGCSLVSGDVIQACEEDGTWTGPLPVCQGNHLVTMF